MAGPGNRPRAVTLALLAFVAIAAGGVYLAHRLTARPAPLQTVVLTMRDYTFNGTNPAFRFHVGDRVRFVVRNEEQTPIRHNFAIPDLGIPCEGEMEPGTIRHVFLTLKRPGTFEYVCCTHRGMGGTLIVAR